MEINFQINFQKDNLSQVPETLKISYFIDFSKKNEINSNNNKELNNKLKINEKELKEGNNIIINMKSDKNNKVENIKDNEKNNTSLINKNNENDNINKNINNEDNNINNVKDIKKEVDNKIINISMNDNSQKIIKSINEDLREKENNITKINYKNEDNLQKDNKSSPIKNNSLENYKPYKYSNSKGLYANNRMFNQQNTFDRNKQYVNKRQYDNNNVMTSDDNKELFITGIKKETSESIIKEKFAKYGEIDSIHFSYNKNFPLTKACYIKFKENASASKAMKEADKITCEGNKLTIKYNNRKTYTKSRENNNNITKDNEHSPNLFPYKSVESNNQKSIKCGSVRKSDENIKDNEDNLSHYTNRERSRDKNLEDNNNDW